MPDSAVTCIPELDSVLKERLYVSDLQGSATVTPKDSANSEFSSKLSPIGRMPLPPDSCQSFLTIQTSFEAFDDPVRISVEPGAVPTDVYEAEPAFEPVVADANSLISELSSLSKVSLVHCNAFSMETVACESDDLVPRALSKTGALFEDPADLKVLDEEDFITPLSVPRIGGVVTKTQKACVHSFSHIAPRWEIFYDPEQSVYVDELALLHREIDREQQISAICKELLERLY